MKDQCNPAIIITDAITALNITKKSLTWLNLEAFLNLRENIGISLTRRSESTSEHNGIIHVL